MQLIVSEEDLAAGIAALAGLDAAMAGLAAAGVAPVLRKRAPGFPGLVSVVMGQQVSTASAAAILARLEAAAPGLSADAVAGLSDEALLAVGLSRAKLRTVRAIALALENGTLPLDRLHDEAPETAQALLTAVPGIGPWTAEIYLLFCLGHPDVFPAGDLALQEAARALLGLPSRPDARALRQIAARWAPHRGIAAYLLWAHYRQLRSREGAPPG